MATRVLARLWVDLFRDALNTTAYLAEQANLIFEIVAGDTGLELTFSGFSDKLLLFSEEIVRALFEFDSTAPGPVSRLPPLLEAATKRLRNALLDPAAHASVH